MTKTIIPRILAATGVIISVAVLFGIAFEQTKESSNKEIVKNVEVVYSNENQKKICFGSMKITLPEGWKAEERIDEEGFNRCVLIDAHSESENSDLRGHHIYYEHEIEIIPYEVLRFPETQLEFLSDLMHYFGFRSVENLMMRDIQPRNSIWLFETEDYEKCIREYFVFSRTGSGCGEIFEIKESSSVSPQEGIVESFRDYLLDSLITLGDDQTGLPLISSGDKDEFRIFNRDSENELLVGTHAVRDDEGIVDTAIVSVFEASTLDKISEFYRDYYPGVIVLMDIDKDGMEDFLTGMAFTSDYEGYIWNQDKQEFECYSKEELLSMYGEFYLEEPLDEVDEEALIPESLIAFISENLQEGTENLSEAMLPFECGEMLSEEEVKEIAEETDEIKVECLKIGAYYGEGNFLKVDADNDGIEDIFLEEYTGGTLYLVDRMLFRGCENGSYEKTYEDDGIHQKFRFIRWEEKNYLIRTTFNFDQKVDDGVYVQSFDGGELADEKWINLTIKDKTRADYAEVSWIADEKYRELAENLTSFERLITQETTAEGGYYEEEKQPVGSGETYSDSEDYPWQSDINNDGEAESYIKYIWYPSNYGMRKRLAFNFEGEDILQERVEEFIDNEDGIAGYGTETLMWVDETEFGKITYILYEDGLFDFYVCGYYISPEQIEKVLQVDFKFKQEATVREES